MAKDKPKPEPKMSDICGKCRGTGTEEKEEQFLVNFGGSMHTETRTRTITCKQCGGLGEYPMI